MGLSKGVGSGLTIWHTVGRSKGIGSGSTPIVPGGLTPMPCDRAKHRLRITKLRGCQIFSEESNTDWCTPLRP